MDARIVEQERIVLVGVAFYGDPFAQSAGWTEENEIGRLWRRFQRTYETLREELPPPSREGVMYEVHVTDAHTLETGEYEVFVGYPVTDPLTAPPSVLVKVLPATRVALFHTVGEEVGADDVYAAMESWITDRGCRRSGSWMYNRYDGRFRGIGRLGESELDVGIPVE